MLTALAVVVALVALLLFIAWAAQRTLIDGLPPRETVANAVEGIERAYDYAAKNGGVVSPVRGTGSMSPFIRAGAPDEIVAFAVSRKAATFRDVAAGDVCIYHGATGPVIHSAASLSSAGWKMSGIANARADIYMSEVNFVGIVAKVWVWKS